MQKIRTKEFVYGAYHGILQVQEWFETIHEKAKKEIKERGIDDNVTIQHFDLVIEIIKELANKFESDNELNHDTCEEIRQEIYK